MPCVKHAIVSKVTGLSGMVAQQLAALECRIHHVEQSGASCEQLTSSIQDVQIILQDVQDRALVPVHTPVSFFQGIVQIGGSCVRCVRLHMFPS